MDYTRYKTLNVEKTDKVLTVTLNRPHALNAVNLELHRELSTIFAEIRQDAEVHAVVLTGAGRAFSAGGDLTWFQQMTSTELDALFFEARKLIFDLLDVEQPVIAAINGVAVGLGATLALFSDIILAARSARIGDAHVLVGLVAGDGGSVIWPWLVGAARAKEFLMTGDLITAQEAERIGLINRVVPDEALMPTAMELATKLANAPTRAIRGTKASVNKMLRDSVNLVLDSSLALEKETFRTADHREAVAAFLEKRRPNFKGT
ncbi:MAG: enoyl-CoA hydratase/isomerase family protein [Dehalococcoidia bacterium]|nr:enoyl-CoA hydratase/isomerase family protein [Dehalococcoidia bacterium]